MNTTVFAVGFITTVVVAVVIAIAVIGGIKEGLKFLGFLLSVSVVAVGVAFFWLWAAGAFG